MNANTGRYRRAEFNLIVDGAEYFTANLAGGWVRVGCIGSYCFDFPADHKLHAEISAAASEAEAEAIFDICAGTYLKVPEACK